ncbi:flagellar protein FlaG [Cohnella lubricantis]|uniref:Flagellar protein FlaG n=1 Tax=Cohnella lubricantis TaxID=2163172 RepID=A0A841TBK1_9BACL|nr:flagellar protein FlaG [Cohnella lubricantis]MBB6677405.1 flagellar protein FlaG [Cohnella lubricantis]MBP2118704.1 flagellar protein FlaG [Cohnella lubricantis]
MDVSFNTASSAPVRKLSNEDASNRDNHDTPAVSLTQPDLLEKRRNELSVSEEALVKTLQRAQKMVEGAPRKFDYEIYHDRVVVKVINSETDEVIREIPPEKFIDLVDKLVELSGMIIDEKR